MHRKDTARDPETIWIVLDRIAQGDANAKDDLIASTHARLEALSRKMFGSFQRLRGVADCDDVFQEAAMRLLKSLDQVRPTTKKEFFGLATLQIRRVLLDLCRKVKDVPDLPVPHPPTGSTTSECWARFHEEAAKLPQGVHEIFDLLWYQELTQKEAAEVLEVDESTVKRRWRRAREHLADKLADCLPHMNIRLGPPGST